MSLLEQDITKKGRVDKKVKQTDFDTSDNNNGEYKMKAIRNNAVYKRESESGHLVRLYYLVS